MLDDDFLDAAPQQLRNCLLFAGRADQQGHFIAARQEDVGQREDLSESLAHLGNRQHLLADVRIKRDRPALRLDDLDGLDHRLDDLRRKERRAHHVEVGAALEHVLVHHARRELAGRAIDDVEDEIAVARFLVGDEGAAGRGVLQHGDGRRVGAVLLQAVDVHPAEVVVADAADDAAGETELGDLVEIDRRRAARIGTDQRARLAERLSDSGSHDLDEDFAHGHDLAHCLPPVVDLSPHRPVEVMVIANARRATRPPSSRLRAARSRSGRMRNNRQSGSPPACGIPTALRP